MDVRRRRVDYHHAARGGGLDVDVVQADAGPADDLQLGCCGEHLGVDGGRQAHQYRVGVDDGLRQLRAVRTVDPPHLDVVAECLDGRRGQLVGN